MKITIDSKKLLIGFIILWIIAFAVSKATEYYISSTTPDFLEQMEKDAMTGSYISTKIGKQIGFESTYNDNDLATDTLKFKVKVQGEDGKLLLSGKAIKSGADWIPVKLDSTYQEN